MGFFDTLKKSIGLADKSLDIVDDKIREKISRKNDSELLLLDKKNKYVREELKKRGLN